MYSTLTREPVSVDFTQIFFSELCVIAVIGNPVGSGHTYRTKATKAHLSTQPEFQRLKFLVTESQNTA